MTWKAPYIPPTDTAGGNCPAGDPNGDTGCTSHGRRSGGHAGHGLLGGGHTVVDIPGSKSLTNRYLVLAALGREPVTIHHPLVARDTELMAGALEALGARVERGCGDFAGDAAGGFGGNAGSGGGSGIAAHDAAWTVHPGPWHGGTVECGLAGTVMRFIPPLAAFASEPVQLDGDPAARVRPMDTIVTALRELGVEVAAATHGGAHVLPMTVRGTGRVTGGTLTIDASASSQFVSALLLAAPLMDRGLELRHDGAMLPSQPHIDMTVEVLREAGIDVATAPDTWRVHPGVPQLPEVTVEPDLSNAGAFLAGAMVTGRQVTIPHWPLHTTQPGDAYRQIFADMGADVTLKADSLAGSAHASTGALTVAGPERILPYDADMKDVGELVPSVAAVAAFADGTSRLRNIGQLRGHETNRLAALTTELGKIGIQAWEDGEDLVIDGGTPARPAVVESYDDHRMATFGAILGLRINGVEVVNIGTTAKTLPEFVELWTAAFGGADV